MFKNVTIELSPDELTKMIEEQVKQQYKCDCKVTFEVQNSYSGYGPNESATPTFKYAKVKLVPISQF